MDIAFYILGVMACFKYLGLLNNILAWSFLGMFMVCLGATRIGWYAYLNVKKNASTTNNNNILNESKALLDQAKELSKNKWQTPKT